MPHVSVDPVDDIVGFLNPTSVFFELAELPRHKLRSCVILDDRNVIDEYVQLVLDNRQLNRAKASLK